MVALAARRDFVGNPEEVIEKILYQHELFHHDRFLLQLTVGTLPHKKVLRAIELLGTKVAPAVRKALGKGQGAGEGHGGGEGAAEGYPDLRPASR